MSLRRDRINWCASVVSYFCNNIISKKLVRHVIFGDVVVQMILKHPTKKF